MGASPPTADSARKAPPADPPWSSMDPDAQLKCLRYRAWHRGTREADMLVGGYFDAHHRQWGTLERDWFADLLEEQDVDIMAWAIGTAEPPERLAGEMMNALKRLDYIRIAR